MLTSTTTTTTVEVATSMSSTTTVETTTSVLVETTTTGLMDVFTTGESFEDGEDAKTGKGGAEDLIPLIANGALRKMSNSALEIQEETEKIEYGCKVSNGLERMVHVLITMLSLILNLYLMLAYPVMMYTERRELRGRLSNREKKREDRISDLKMNLGLDV